MMEKLLEETKSGSARADYIKVKPNERLHITHAGKGWALTLFVLIFIVVSSCNKTSESPSDSLRPANFTDKQWLGKQLFFDTNLSEPAGLACAGSERLVSKNNCLPSHCLSVKFAGRRESLGDSDVLLQDDTTIKINTNSVSAQPLPACVI